MLVPTKCLKVNGQSYSFIVVFFMVLTVPTTFPILVCFTFYGKFGAGTFLHKGKFTKLGF